MLNKPETVYTIDMLIQKILDDEKQYDLSKIISAYEFAAKAHANQVRSSGEPYITHPLAVSYILLELGMDTDTICAAMLHDVVEDTDVTLEEIKSFSVRTLPCLWTALQSWARYRCSQRRNSRRRTCGRYSLPCHRTFGSLS